MVVLLTRQCHEDSVWITRLVEALRAVGRAVSCVTVEDLLAARSEEEDPIHALLCRVQEGVLVNRVSDAADPITVQFTTSLLQAARLWGVPVFNGPISYSLCVSKWCHHVVLNRAGLTFPETRLVTIDALFRMTDTAALVQRLPPFPLLLKPNAGGFGHGIQRVESFQELQDVVVATRASSTTWKNGETTTTGTEPPVLLQAYIEPQDQLIYRVWFLQGRVQCAVTRTVPTATSLVNHGTTAVSFHNEFSSGCVGGNIGRYPLVTVVDPPDTATTTVFRAWKVPAEVSDEVERIVQVLQDAQAGSVEFLYGRDDGKRYYFDVNLLSTLPDATINHDQVWPTNYDPWAELAAAIIEIDDQTHSISVSDSR